MITRQQLNRELEHIPPFAASLMRLTNIILSGEYSIDDVTRVIRLDQGLTLDVISYANSAESGPAKDITSVSEAIVRMGGARIMRYLLSKWFRGNVSRALGSGKESQLLWKHGVISAMASDVFGDIFPSLSHPAAFTTTLLHDIGRTPLVRWAKQNDILYEWNADDDRMVEYEKKSFGFSHCEIGAMILARWSFPEPIVEAVRNHAEDKGGPEPLTEIIRLANAVCLAIPDEDDPSASPGIRAPILDRHNISDEKIHEIYQSTLNLASATFSEFGESNS